MLQAIREKTSGWIAGVIIFLLVLVMAAYALPSFFGSSFSTAVAEVGDTEIGQGKWSERFSQVRARMAQEAGDAFDPTMVEDPLFKRQTLDQMIDVELLRQDAVAAGASYSAKRLQQQILSYPAFQVDGKFNRDQYLMALQRFGLSVQGLEADLTESALANEIRAALGQSMVVTDAEVDALVRLRDQQRSFRFLRVNVADLADMDEPEPAALEAYYQAHTADYMADEQMDLEYIEVRLDQQQVAAPTDAEVAARYDEIRDSFRQPEQRLASHLLLEVAADADDAARERVQAQAQTLREQIVKGAKFEDVARKSSQDVGTAEQGGDLGWLQRDGTGEPAFDAALFAMTEVGSVSEPVLSSQGVHLILLREIQAERGKLLEEVKDELAERMLTDRRSSAFADLSAALTNELLRDPFQLQGPAEKLGLALQRTGWFPRSMPTGIAALPVVQRELRNELVRERGQVSRVLKGADGQVLAVRVAERKAAEPRPYAEVAEQVKAAYLRTEQEKAVKAKADEWFARAQQEGSLDALITETSKTAETAEGVVRTAANLPAPAVAEAFRMARPQGDQRTVAKVELGPQEVALIELSAVVDGDPGKLDAAARDALREQLKFERSYAEAQAYLASLRQTTDITVHEDRL